MASELEEIITNADAIALEQLAPNLRY